MKIIKAPDRSNKESIVLSDIPNDALIREVTRRVESGELEIDVTINPKRRAEGGKEI